MTGIDFGVAAGITSPIQLYALGLLIFISIVIMVWVYISKKQAQKEAQQKAADSVKLNKQLEEASRKERMQTTELYTKSLHELTTVINNLDSHVNSLDNHLNDVQNAISNLKEAIAQKLDVLTNEYIGELNYTMTMELIDLTLNSARDRILIFCQDVIKNNHISENEIEIKKRIKNYLYQEFQKDSNRLKLFRYGGVQLNTKMNPQWRTTLHDGIVEHLWSTGQSEVVSLRNLENHIKDSFERFKNEMKDSIEEI